MDLFTCHDHTRQEGRISQKGGRKGIKEAVKARWLGFRSEGRKDQKKDGRTNGRTKGVEGRKERKDEKKRRAKGKDSTDLDLVVFIDTRVCTCMHVQGVQQKKVDLCQCRVW